MLAGYVNLLIWIAVVLVASWALDRLWAHSVARWAYIIFAAPGIVVHELSHWAACIITGAKVTRVTLLSREGGSVTHGRPKGGIIGQSFISMAPFFGIPLSIVLLGILFDRLLGCTISWTVDLDGSVGEIVIGMLNSAFDLIWSNIVDRGAYWFILYIYLAASLTIALAPSAQDLKNGIIGLVIVLVAVLIWIVMMERAFPKWDFPVLGPMVDMLGLVVVIGLIAGILGSILALPFFVFRRISGR
jgi:hypothetical protein